MLLTIITFIVVLGLLVFVHELGHFITAKRMGVYVEEFAFGFPPRIFAVKRGETTYAINAIPFGGYVKIKGEGGDHADDQDSFAHKKAWQKVAMLSAGVAMNFALAFVLFTVGFMVGMPQEVTEQDIQRGKVTDVRVMVMEVEGGSPAQQADIRSGDTLRSINGTTFTSPDEAVRYIATHAGEKLSVIIDRGGSDVVVQTQPAVYGQHTAPKLGVSLIRTGLVRYNPFDAVLNGAAATFNAIVFVVVAIIGLIGGLFTGGDVAGQLSGPVGVAVLTGQVARLGVSYLINFTAMLSINLGILNILPFPALDGGRVLFVLLEKAKGRPVSQRIEQTMHTVGFGLLILLALFVTYKDILKYGQGLIRGITGLFS